MFHILKVMLFILSVEYINATIFFFYFGIWILLCRLGKNEKSIKPNNMSTKEEPKPIKV